MTLWLRVRRWRLCAACFIGVIVVIVALGDLVASLPALFSVRGLEIPVALLAPVALSTAIGHGLASGDELLESVAVRPIAWLDTAYVTIWMVGLLVVGAAVQTAGLAELGLAASRNGLGLVGLLLVARPVIGAAAAPAAPALAFVLLAFFGSDASGEPRWWAWTLTPWSDERSWVIGVGLLFVGIAISVRTWQAPWLR